MNYRWLVILPWCVTLAFACVRPLLADPTDRVFDLGHVLEIDFEIAADDWNTIRRQHPDMASLRNPGGAEYYTYVKCSVTIDGSEIGAVGVRKKGFIGSSSSLRPSLKIDFEEYDELEFSGMNRLTLNNNQQDPSNMHQVLVYHLFRKAGIPAPRCSYATVTVNGEAKGLFSNVEPVKKPFLKRHFDDTSGNLYEGRRSDFRRDWTVSFEKKTNKKDTNRADLDALVKALEADDADVIQAIGQLVDVDAFLRFWAMECLVGHWDGYAENLNNFYLYNDPTTGKFHFIPWGADSAFGDSNDFLEFEPPVSVRAVGMLSRRLYNHPDTRERYQETLTDLLNNVWDENELSELVSRLDGIIKERSPKLRGYAASLAKIRKFIETRREVLEADLREPAARWEFPLPDELMMGVGDPKGSITATFKTKWAAGNMINPFAGSKIDFNLNWDEDVPKFLMQGASAGPFPELFRHGYPYVLIGGVTTNGHMFGASLIVDPESFQPGKLPLDMFNVMGVIIDFDITAGKPRPEIRGFLSGTLEFDTAGTEKGDEVSGTLKAEIR